MQKQDLLGHLVHGTDPVLRVVAGVGRTALDLDVETPGAFALDLERVGMGGSRFDDKHLLTLHRFAFDPLARTRATEFFIAGAQETDLPVIEQSKINEGLGRPNGLNKSGLHVQYTRAVKLAVLDFHGQAPDIPDCVEVPEDSRALRAFTDRENEMVTVRFTRNDFDASAKTLRHDFPKHLPAGIDRTFICRR
ncbi:hypothetical protein D3C76_1164860 [compost metagenome]